MYAYRTVFARTCYAGIVGCLLVGSSSALAAANPSGFHVLSSKAAEVKSGQYIQASVHSAYNHGTMGNQRIYTRQMVPVAPSTLRVGALSALGRGVMHPGFQVAILAAGFIISNNDIYTYDINNPASIDISQYPVEQGYGWTPTTTDYRTGVYDNPATACLTADLSSLTPPRWITSVSPESSTMYRCRMASESSSAHGSFLVSKVANDNPLTINDAIRPATLQEIENIDSYIPPSLYDELFNGGPIPEWQDEITVLGAPATYVQPTGDQAIAPEVALAVGKWGENVAADLEGQERPHTDTPTTGGTATEQLYEDLGLYDPVPPFPDLDVEWQTEQLELPAYSSGVGAGQCPAPVQIPFPLGEGSFGWSYEPACELADTIKPGFIGMCAFIALLIVLRARGGE